LGHACSADGCSLPRIRILWRRFQENTRLVQRCRGDREASGSWTAWRICPKGGRRALGPLLRQNQACHAVTPVNGHDELLARRCLRHRHTRPLSVSLGGKRDHRDDGETDVGVDAVLSADVGDAPMRQCQYRAGPCAFCVDAACRARNTARDKSPRDFRLPNPGRVGQKPLRRHRGVEGRTVRNSFAINAMWVSTGDESGFHASRLLLRITLYDKVS
jgi:hypothetical protein